MTTIKTLDLGNISKCPPIIIAQSAAKIKAQLANRFSIPRLVNIYNYNPRSHRINGWIDRLTSITPDLHDH